MSGKLLMIYICNFHVLSNFLMIYICKLYFHWNPGGLFTAYEYTMETPFATDNPILTSGMIGLTRNCHNLTRNCHNLTRTCHNLTRTCHNLTRTCHNLPRNCYNLTRILLPGFTAGGLHGACHLLWDFAGHKLVLYQNI
jgi:hypothetical protein